MTDRDRQRVDMDRTDGSRKPGGSSRLQLRAGGILAVLILLGCCCGESLAQGFSACGTPGRGFGPFDYRTVDEKTKRLVEDTHFTADVEHLRHGNTSSLGGDIGYTLAAFPNQPRALLAMMKLSEREKTEKPRGARLTMECYLIRAIEFAPNDGTVRVLFGIYLSKKGQKGEAIKQLEAARELAGDDPNLYYNLGLAYFDLKDYAQARESAKRAYELGFPLGGLKKKLQSVGEWRD